MTSPQTRRRVLGGIGSDRCRKGLAAAIAAGLLMNVETTPAAATGVHRSTTAAATCVLRTTSTDWKAAIADAKTALAKAQTRIAHGHYKKAKKQLRRMKRKTQIANTAAKSLIGKPPTDPESDDPPGPTAVLKVAGLDHKITQTVVPLFSDPHGRKVTSPLANGLLQADACREMMLEAVIDLKPGKRDDYVDGLSDTLAVYPKELTAISVGLHDSGVTPTGHDALILAQAIVTETNAAMQRVFGGGERSR